MTKCHSLFGIAVFFYLGVAFAELPQGLQDSRVSSLCRVEVSLYKKTGLTDVLTYFPNVKSKAACEKAGRAHRTNFNPHRVRSVAVKVSWLGY